MLKINYRRTFTNTADYTLNTWERSVLALNPPKNVWVATRSSLKSEIFVFLTFEPKMVENFATSSVYYKKILSSFIATSSLIPGNPDIKKIIATGQI